MITEIVNVLAQIVKGMNENSSAEELAKKIKKESKFDDNIIAAAYSWIYEKNNRELKKDTTDDTQSSTGFRFIGKDEIDAIGVTNSNYLIHLHNIKLLNNKDLETIIERIKDFPEDVINFDHINLLILTLYLNVDDVTPPGSRQLLYSSDTIN
jgi:uncharacterized protein Smg (DUF494 family)